MTVSDRKYFAAFSVWVLFILLSKLTVMEEKNYIFLCVNTETFIIIILIYLQFLGLHFAYLFSFLSTMHLPGTMVALSWKVHPFP